VDSGRARTNLKRGGGARQVSLDEAMMVSADCGDELIALDDALDALARLNPRQSRVVELRYFGGLSEEETAEALNVSARTVRRDWGLARAWLYRELRRGDEDVA
jgi:RNA polymerase sigma factor (TIGR02999 family)